MKILMSILALTTTCFIYAQQPNPVAEKQGEQIRVTYFHDNGEIAQVGHFLNGKLHGEWKMFNEAGQKLAVGQYENGRKVGKWFFWDAEGLNEVDYRNNEIAHVVQWNKGEVVVINR